MEIKKFNRKELIEVIAQKTGSQISAIRAVNSVLGGIKSILASEEKGTVIKLNLPNFGTFMVYDSRPRPAKNPKTGEDLEIPSKRKVIFMPAIPFKKSLQKEEE